jgi:KDO2-lipid IV(A) lauroyltransferase
MYYLVYGLLWLISLLPLPVLYFFGDCIYGVIFYLVQYRKDVVLSNLLLAFPEKTSRERKKIAKKFYHNFIDTFIESIKLLSMSKAQLLKRNTGEFELINGLLKRGKNVHGMAGHQFNWEFGNLLYALNLHASFVGIYMPISNKIVGRIFYDLRKRYGTVLISAPDFKNKMHSIFTTQYMMGLAADQNPGNPANGYWMNFMGKPVPFVTGPGKGAVRNNTAVVFVGFEKIKRGFYHFSARLLAEEGADHSAEQLTLLYKNALEDTIRKDPSNYLWSHRRWRYEWKPEYGPIIQ